MNSEQVAIVVSLKRAVDGRDFRRHDNFELKEVAAS